MSGLDFPYNACIALYLNSHLSLLVPNPTYVPHAIGHWCDSTMFLKLSGGITGGAVMWSTIRHWDAISSYGVDGEASACDDVSSGDEWWIYYVLISGMICCCGRKQPCFN